jgi:hypothetical protein
MTTVEKLGGKKLSPTDRRILRLLINAGWRIYGQRAHPHPWRYEARPPAGQGGAAVSLNTDDVLRLGKRGLIEVSEFVSDDAHWLTDSLTGRRAFRTGQLEQPIEQQSFLDPAPKRGRNAVDR